MLKFYFYLWFNWSIRLTLTTLLYSIVFASIVTFYIYFKQGFPAFNDEVNNALLSIWQFWFLTLGNVALLVALFSGMKYIFNHCYNGYSLELYSCEDIKVREKIEDVGYGDLVKVWRKWFMLIIWLTGVQMIFSLAISTIIGIHESVFVWFNSLILYGFILISGYFSFIILSAKSKKIRLSIC